MDEVTVNNKKKKSKKIFLVGIVAIILVCLFLVYILVFNKPKNIFLNSINNEYKKFDEFVDSNLKNLKNSDEAKTISGNFTFDLDASFDDGIIDEDVSALLEELNKLSIKANYGYDKKNKLLSYDISALYDNDSLLSVAIYGSESKLYMELKNLFDKYIEIPIDDYDVLFQDSDSNIENSKYIIDTIKSSILNNMKAKDFKSSNATILIGSKEIKTKKITYTLTKEVAKALMVDVIEDLNKNDKFIKSLADITNKDESEIKDELASAKDDFEYDSDSDGESIELSIYTHGINNSAIQYEFTINSSTDSYALVYSDYQDVKRISFRENDTNIISVVNEKGKDSDYVTTVVVSSIKATINSKKENNDWIHSYKITAGGSDGEIRGEVKTSNVFEENEYKNSLSFTLGIGEKNKNDMVSVKGSVVNNFRPAEKIDVPNIENSVSIYDLTEDDSNTITNNILNDNALVNFIERVIEIVNKDIDYIDETDYDMEEEVYNY